FNLAFGDKLSQVQFKTGQAKTAVSVALAVATSDNTASALIGQGAFLTVNGNLPVSATATDPFQISASGKAGTFGGPSESSYGGAIAYAKDANQANAFIGWNAVVDVRKALSLTTDAEIPSPVNPLDLALSLADFGQHTQVEAVGDPYSYARKATA